MVGDPIPYGSGNAIGSVLPYGWLQKAPIPSKNLAFGPMERWLPLVRKSLSAQDCQAGGPGRKIWTPFWHATAIPGIRVGDEIAQAAMGTPLGGSPC